MRDVMKPTLILLFMLTSRTMATFTIGPSRLDRFRQYLIVPQIISEPPLTLLTDIYGDYRANLGNRIPTCATLNPSITSWVHAINTQLYALICIDPDVTQIYYTPRQSLYGLIVNIPGSNTVAGEILAPYKAPLPVPGSGDHRFICLVFKQITRINVTTELLISIARNNYGNFSVTEFVKRFNLLPRAEAGNFFLSRQTLCDPPCDETCPQVNSCDASYTTYND